MASAGTIGLLDYEESLGSSKVLQGQENEILISSFHRSDARTRIMDFQMQIPASQSLVPGQVRKANNDSFELLRVHQQAYVGTEEAHKFPEVL